MNRVFLSAEWRYLAMLNFAIDPAILKPLVPAGTELDPYNGATYISLIGFLFLKTRVFGIGFPFHRNFEEVNLRFYVRRKSGEGWRRGVVFVRELAPRRAVAFIARAFYGERYRALPMQHAVENNGSGLRVKYAWKQNGCWESIQIAAKGEPQNIAPGSEEEFITEHHWGYTADGTLSHEYRVEHSRWRVWQATEASLDADIGALYGKQFVESLSAKPASAFIADGSPITVSWKSTLSS